MKTYKVGVPQVFVGYFEVEANNANEAREKAEAEWADNNFQLDGPEYTETLGISQWLVEEADAR